MEKYGIWFEDQNVILFISSNEICRRFIKNHNIIPCQAIPLFCDIATLNNEWLSSMARDEEIIQIVHQISSLKAPDPDGMHAIFYGKCQDILRKNICGLVSAFLQHGHILRTPNKTKITLIPNG